MAQLKPCVVGARQADETQVVFQDNGTGIIATNGSETNFWYTVITARRLDVMLKDGRAVELERTPIPAGNVRCDEATLTGMGNARDFRREGRDLRFSRVGSEGSAGTDSRGRARVAFTNSDPDQVYSGDVTCLRVLGTTTGATAVIGVLITDAPFGNTLQGMFITAVDSGKFNQQPDAAGVSFSFTPPP